MSEKLVIQVSGKNDEIDVSSVLDILSSTYALLRHLSEKGKKVTWSLGKISHNSPAYFELVGHENNAIHVLNRFTSGIRAIEKKRSLPRYFDETAIMHSQKIAKHLQNGVSSVTFRYGSKEYKASLNALLMHDDKEIEPYRIWTEVEGFLEAINVHAKNSEFRIYDRITDRSTVCYFKNIDPETLGSHLKHRVRVFGHAKIDKDGHPERIIVRDFCPIGPKVSLKELHEAGFKLSGTMSSAEVIRFNRDLDD